MSQGNCPVLLVDQQKDITAIISSFLVLPQFTLYSANTLSHAKKLFTKFNPAVIIILNNSIEQKDLELISALKQYFINTPIILISKQRDPKLIVQVMRLGVYDYLIFPVTKEELQQTLVPIVELYKETSDFLAANVKFIEKSQKKHISLLERMGTSTNVQALVKLLVKIAPTPFTVLIEGESGAGKELVARSIHEMSKVSHGKFIAVDCGAIPENLFESELFGYIKGAFTGAETDKKGFFEAADNGTLFLDEVCNLSYVSQQKLLRVIEERKVQRIGTTRLQEVNVRIIAATNRSLEEATLDKTFRIDLLHRIKEIMVRVPPLRERKDDIKHLAEYFLEDFQQKLDTKCSGISNNALEELKNYPWPGNVRELKNVVRQAALICDAGELIELEHLPFLSNLDRKIHTQEKHTPLGSFDIDINKPFSLSSVVNNYSCRLEKTLIEQVLKASNNNKAEAARRLNIDYKTLHRKRKQLGIN